MKGETKKRKTPGEMREVLAQNINRLMEQRYKENSNRPLALANDAGVSLSSVQRTLSRETGASIDTVEAFAKVLLPGLPAFQLIVPWGLLGEISASQGPLRWPATARRVPLFRGTGRTQRRQNAAVARRRRTAG